jgi:hypothetical protein
LSVEDRREKAKDKNSSNKIPSRDSLALLGRRLGVGKSKSKTDRNERN